MAGIHATRDSRCTSKTMPFNKPNSPLRCARQRSRPKILSPTFPAGRASTRPSLAAVGSFAVGVAALRPRTIVESRAVDVPHAAAIHQEKLIISKPLWTGSNLNFTSVRTCLPSFLKIVPPFCSVNALLFILACASSIAWPTAR